MFQTTVHRRLNTVFLALAFFFVAGGAAFAGEITPFDQKKFEAAQAAGKTILVDVHADWCGTCQKQAPAIEKLSKDKAFSGAEFLRVNFDSDKEAVRLFNVQKQSTLIVFKGSAEKARSTGETDPQKIRALLEKGV